MSKKPTYSQIVSGESPKEPTSIELKLNQFNEIIRKISNCHRQPWDKDADYYFSKTINYFEKFFGEKSTSYGISAGDVYSFSEDEYYKYILIWAASYGYFDLIKFIYNQEESKCCVCPEYSINYAVINNNLEIVKYLHDLSCHRTSDVIDNAIKNGYVDIFDFLLENGYSYSKEVIYDVVKNNHLNMLKRLHQLNFMLTPKLFVLSVRFGCFEIMLYLHENNVKSNKDLIYIALDNLKKYISKKNVEKIDSYFKTIKFLYEVLNCCVCSDNISNVVNSNTYKHKQVIKYIREKRIKEGCKQHDWKFV